MFVADFNANKAKIFHRSCCFNSVAIWQYTEPTYASREGVKRIEFLPIEWRLSLSLNEESIKVITPKGVEKLRSTLHETLLDILYFTSPKYVLYGMVWYGSSHFALSLINEF